MKFTITILTLPSLYQQILCIHHMKLLNEGLIILNWSVIKNYILCSERGRGGIRK